MLAWLYRLLFARRSTWKLIREPDCYLSFTLFDATAEDIARQLPMIQALLLDGWTLVARPKGGWYP